MVCKNVDSFEPSCNGAYNLPSRIVIKLSVLLQKYHKDIYFWKSGIFGYTKAILFFEIPEDTPIISIYILKEFLMQIVLLFIQKQRMTFLSYIP